MEMHYYIENDSKTSAANHFPERLSFFFEQFRELGSFSEVSQVSEILSIDLSLFLKTASSGIGQPDPEMIETGTLLKKVNEFILRLEEQPWYFKVVKYRTLEHNPYVDVLEGLSRDLEEVSKLGPEKIQEFLANLKSRAEKNKNTADPYPPNLNYLSSKRINQDLQLLKNRLNELEKEGTRQIRLHFAQE
jgi:hypothetical protein